VVIWRLALDEDVAAKSESGEVLRAEVQGERKVENSISKVPFFLIFS